jgi:predicted transcriptional regulator of viral defense system
LGRTYSSARGVRPESVSITPRSPVRTKGTRLRGTDQSATDDWTASSGAHVNTQSGYHNAALSCSLHAEKTRNRCNDLCYAQCVISEAPGLSKREQALLAAWEREGIRSITLRQIQESVGPGSARVVASRLVRKGVLDRLRPGLYAVRPFRAAARPWIQPTLVAIEFLLVDKPHYVGGLAAFTLNRLTTQQYTSLVDVFVLSYLPPRRLGNARVVFHRRRQGTFSTGITTFDVDGVAVSTSDRERTVLDALEEFRVVGGMDEAIKLFAEALPKINPQVLVAQALAIARDSTCQRLGVLLERANVEGAYMTELAARASRSSGIHLLIPGRPRSGPLHQKWHVIENDQATE